MREAGVDGRTRRAAAAVTLNLVASASVGYPSGGVFPSVGDFRTNWSLVRAVQVPIFTGSRLRADELAARADLAQAAGAAEAGAELAELDAATALQDLAAAEAVWEASAGTVQQAERAYQIAELRNREGLVDAARAVRLAPVAASRAGQPRAGRARCPGRARAGRAAAQSSRGA